MKIRCVFSLYAFASRNDRSSGQRTYPSAPEPAAAMPMWFVIVPCQRMTPRFPALVTAAIGDSPSLLASAAGAPCLLNHQRSANGAGASRDSGDARRLNWKPVVACMRQPSLLKNRHCSEYVRAEDRDAIVRSISCEQHGFIRPSGTVAQRDRRISADRKYHHVATRFRVVRSCSQRCPMMLARPRDSRHVSR
jgi:hypothetical protein